jgi:hypothetical protein
LLLAKLRRRQGDAQAHEAPKTAGRAQRWSFARQLLLWTSTPDEYVGWLPWALWRGWRLVRKERIDAILASGPPFSVVLAGSLLGRLTRKPFVADLRDAWVQDPVDPFGCLTGSFRATLSRPRRATLALLERRSLAAAGAVLFTSDYTMRAYAQAYRDLEKRSVVLYNGAEESDFVSPAEASPGFVFTYVGTLHEYQREQVALFLRAFSLARQQEADLAPSLVRICGQRPAYLDAAIARVASETSVEAQLRCEPVVPHRRAMALLKGADILVLFAGTSLFIRPSKLSEYLTTGRPVLALATRGGEAATQVERAGQTVYDGDSPDELAAVVVRLWRDHRAERHQDRPFPYPYPHALNWKSAAAVVASTLNRLCGMADDLRQRSAQ